MFLVTVKLPKNPEHNPRDKKTGPCPVNGEPCTDVTGAHHTVLADGLDHLDAESVRDLYQGDGHCVTRVETV